MFWTVHASTSLMQIWKLYFPNYHITFIQLKNWCFAIDKCIYLFTSRLLKIWFLWSSGENGWRLETRRNGESREYPTLLQLCLGLQVFLYSERVFLTSWTALLVSPLWSSSVVMSGFLYIQCYVSDVELYHWDGGQDKESPGRSPGAESPGPRGAVPVDAQTCWGDGRWYEEAIQRPDGSHPQTDRGPRLRCPKEGRYRKL